MQGPLFIETLINDLYEWLWHKTPLFTAHIIEKHKDTRIYDMLDDRAMYLY